MGQSDQGKGASQQQGGGSAKNPQQQGGGGGSQRQHEQSGAGRPKSRDEEGMSEGDLDAGNVGSSDVSSKENRERKPDPGSRSS